MHQKLQRVATQSSHNVDEAELLDVLKRIMSKLILNNRENTDYATVERYFPDLVMCLHNQAPYLKQYTYHILSQIYWTETNKSKNSLMPVNNLQKDTKSSDPIVRADAIKLLTDMASNLNDCAPFLYETVKGGIADKNPYV